MASMTSAINVQVNSKTKEDATKVLKNLGLSMSSAIEIFLNQVILNDGIPFEVTNRKPSRSLRRALKQAEKIEKNPDKYPSYKTREELKKALLDD